MLLLMRLPGLGAQVNHFWCHNVFIQIRLYILEFRYGTFLSKNKKKKKRLLMFFLTVDEFFFVHLCLQYVERGFASVRLFPRTWIVDEFFAVHLCL